MKVSLKMADIEVSLEDDKQDIDTLADLAYGALVLLVKERVNFQHACDAEPAEDSQGELPGEQSHRIEPGGLSVKPEFMASYV